MILKREAGPGLEARVVLVPFHDCRLELLKAEAASRRSLVRQVLTVPAAQLDRLLELSEQSPPCVGGDVQGHDQVDEPHARRPTRCAPCDGALCDAHAIEGADGAEAAQLMPSHHEVDLQTVDGFELSRPILGAPGRGAIVDQPFEQERFNQLAKHTLLRIGGLLGRHLREQSALCAAPLHRLRASRCGWSLLVPVAQLNQRRSRHLVPHPASTGRRLLTATADPTTRSHPVGHCTKRE
jgi:hypothetical protein